jgi:hypothetical protein
MLKNSKFLKILVLISFLLMIGINGLANALPINGITTGELSDTYPNLFTPAGLTFSIWGVIYLLLGIYVIYQFLRKETSKEKNKVFDEINKLFIINAILNASWIIAWHYEYVLVSLFIMIGLLISLIKIADTINKAKFITNEKLITKAPFGIYFGWINIATIANVTVFLVSIGWNGFGVPDYLWVILVLFIGVIIASVRAINDRNIFYALVPIWAYLGIYIKHTSQGGFQNMYPQVIMAVVICLALLIGLNGYLLISKKAL